MVINQKGDLSFTSENESASGNVASASIIRCGLSDKVN